MCVGGREIPRNGSVLVTIVIFICFSMCVKVGACYKCSYYV